METNDPPPRIVVFEEAPHYWLGDGAHRLEAAKKRGQKTIWAEVHPGGRIKAAEFAIAANRTHGRRPTNADKRKTVVIALEILPQLSNRQIAEKCGVGDTLVNEVRRKQVPEKGTSSAKVVGADGKTYPAHVKHEPPSKAKPHASAPLVARAKPAKKRIDPNSHQAHAETLSSGLESMIILADIEPGDPERIKVLTNVRDFCEEQLSKTLAQLGKTDMDRLDESDAFRTILTALEEHEQPSAHKGQPNGLLSAVAQSPSKKDGAS